MMQTENAPTQHKKLQGCSGEKKLVANRQFVRTFPIHLYSRSERKMRYVVVKMPGQIKN
jgi:hypothetical protein